MHEKKRRKKEKVTIRRRESDKRERDKERRGINLLLGVFRGGRRRPPLIL